MGRGGVQIISLDAQPFAQLLQIVSLDAQSLVFLCTQLFMDCLP